ncbi:HEPN domain-containing protein [Massilia sp. DJPM01]|uniref:HEPN domain-containing protein n=1 Tax=Massilia sp. DJPM01 TaxID=3024404 RepID=UPI00259E542A|nr:HEPN domain-containing protein [Massilia sp. DJPM01]MDM5176730.1 HEPN domain-containing protein [Massilia sp. DJPM01]
MNSRLRVQSFIEQEVGCSDVEKWKTYNSQFLKYEVNAVNLPALHNLLIEDTEDLYFKAILSLVEAVNAINRGLHSWAVVKLYYSVFYLLRCSFAANGYCFAKSAGIYTLKLEIGEKPTKRDVGKRDGESIRGDHKTVIATYLKEFGHDDIFLTNHVIDNINVYD